MADGWRVWIDTGGTFTDCIAVDPGGAVHRAKVLSSGALRGRVDGVIDERIVVVDARWPRDLVRGFRFRVLGRDGVTEVTGFDSSSGLLELAGPHGAAVGDAFEVAGDEEAPILAARLVTGTPAGAALPPLDLRLATTRGTNALLERAGADVAFFVTRGFADLLVIGDQQRPDLFALNIVKPEPLHTRVVEVDERLAADGTVLAPLDMAGLERSARSVAGGGIRSAAVALLHAYRNPAHERAVAAVLRDAGFTTVACSADLAPLIKIVPRAQTACVEAYLAPIVRGYLDRVGASVRGRMHVMTSAGGLVPAESARASDMLLSGPAGGVAGARAAGRRSGFDRVIGFDMGGTSTDVARVHGDFEYRFEHQVGPARLASPALAIETVAAGGGSICWSDRGAPAVGPRSAGADPGPACYGAGGPLTLTDVNLLLGRLDPARFGIPIDVDAARRAFGQVKSELDGDVADDALLEGFLRIANERMAGAIGEVSVRRGHDPRDDVLVAFGGAGGQHACAVADRLDMDTVLMPADASLLSAVGLGDAVIERFRTRQVLRPLHEIAGELEGMIAEMSRAAAADVAAEGVAEDEITVRRTIVNLRLAGQDSTIAVEASPRQLAEAFAERYRALYGHEPEQRPIEVESLRVFCSAQPSAAPRPTPAGHGAEMEGPALIHQEGSTLVVEAGWTATVDDAGSLVARRTSPRADGAAELPEQVQARLFANRLTSIATQMGRMLERTALSTNVKERLDFSCALLDAEGRLVVNAPHMPVHLGALGLCVRSVATRLDMSPGDVIVTNHPAFGGSHLPDLTVITPVHVDGALIGYAASRAHHAELGGTRPGSMPPDARTLVEEGVVIEPRHLVRGGRALYGEIETLLATAPHPSRAVAENLADLRAQVAANRHGVEALADLAREQGAATLRKHMEGILRRAEHLAGAALTTLGTRRFEAAQTLAAGTPIRVAIDVAGGGATIDFAGSGAVHSGNLNATEAIARSAVIYVIRLLVGEPIPLNEGLMRAIDVRIPPGLLNPDFSGADPPAVSGGNVETSQRLVDVLLEAFELAACSQGTMNNLLVGNDAFSYYETICGGAGATPGAAGASAVHTHMTNTRITDPEILEHRYPMRLHRFAVRRGSGGCGRHPGGDGVVRELEFLAPLTVSIVSQRRLVAPCGLDGGGDGATGRTTLTGRGELAPVDGAEVAPGDRLVIETPGGGGWGATPTAPPAGR